MILIVLSKAILTKMAVFWVVAPCRLVEVYGVTPQKTAIFVLTAVRTSKSY
jgi:hypothetical protein